MPKKKRLIVAAVAVATIGGLAFTVPASAEDDGTTDIQLLAINDFHGNLEPPEGSDGELTELDEDGKEHTVEAGGAEYLATHLEDARQGHDNSATVAAGDVIGASPFTSAAFHDEPTIESMEQMGLDVTSVGNHEFDEGISELDRVQEGGCHKEDGCADPDDPYDGADFPYLGANVVDKDSGDHLLPQVSVKDFSGGAKVGFIGMTLEDTGNLVTKEGNEKLKFQDEVKTANHYAEKLEDIGVNSVVVLLHEGGLPESPGYNYDCNASGAGSGVSGPVVDIAENLDSRIDTVVTGHTHEAYDCNIPDPDGNDRLVTSGSSFGKLYTDIQLKYDNKTGDIVRSDMAAKNRAVTRDVDEDKQQTRLIDKYSKLAEPIANEKVGYIGEDIGRGDSEARESALGDLIADVQLEETADEETQIAFMNPGGVRANLKHAESDGEGDGVVTHGEAFTVQPFGNNLVTMDLSGKQIVKMLQQQFTGDNEKEPQVLQPSKGFNYTVDEDASGADKVVTDSIELDGEPLDTSESYRVAVNIFLAGGGDGFSVLPDGGNQVVGESDLDAMENWFADNSSKSDPVKAPKTDRITFK